MYSRRQFVARAGSVAAASVFTPQALAAGLTSAKKTPLLSDVKFASGVMSGDPTPNSIVLWTKLHGAGQAGGVKLEVAKDEAFKDVVAHKTVGTDSSLGYTAKAKVSGLSPHQRYYYRFETKDETSPVGRLQTALPPDSNEKVRFAVFSCQDYSHGFYNAHEVMAQDDNIDFVVCLGDYIYAEGGKWIYDYPTFVGINAVRKDPIEFAHTLDQYRKKYSIYRQDKHLRAMHQKFSMVTTWDDHEVADDYFGGKPKKGEYYKANHHDSKLIKSGYRAFFENMPTYPIDASNRIYRALQFGKNVDLIMLDERQYRENQPCQKVLKDGSPDIGRVCDELLKPRRFLGGEQKQFLMNRLKGSEAAWKLVGNEVMMMPAKLGADRFYGFDGWNGYGREREEVLNFIKNNGIKDTLFLTGDIHNFFAGDVELLKPDLITPTGETITSEIVFGSITSASLGEITADLGDGLALVGNDSNPNTPQFLKDALLSINPWVQDADADHHGYGIVEATPDALTTTWKRVKTIKRRSTETLPDVSWTFQRGQVGISQPNTSG